MQDFYIKIEMFSLQLVTTVLDFQVENTCFIEASGNVAHYTCGTNNRMYPQMNEENARLISSN